MVGDVTQTVPKGAASEEASQRGRKRFFACQASGKFATQAWQRQVEGIVMPGVPMRLQGLLQAAGEARGD